MTKSFFKNLIGSFALHFCLLLLVIFAKPQTTHLPEVIEVDYRSPEDTAFSHVPLDLPDNAKQIVDQEDKSINDEIDANAKFLSKHNQTVKKQTVAVNRGNFQNKKSQQAEGTNGGGGVPRSAPKPKEQLTLADLSPKMDYSDVIKKHEDQEKLKEQEFTKVAIEKAKSIAQAPSKDPRRPGGAGASQTLDYIKELDPGMETMLSTREFVYYTYYSRIREQLNQHWGPKVKEKVAAIYKQGRRIASSEDKISRLLVTLNKKGQLTKIQIIGDSGLRELDDAAVEAFKLAAPFPNPPTGIIEEDGNIHIRWDFIIEA